LTMEAPMIATIVAVALIGIFTFFYAKKRG
jgi:hypothetical protein